MQPRHGWNSWGSYDFLQSCRPSWPWQVYWKLMKIGWNLLSSDLNLVDVGRYSRISQGVASTPAGGYPTPVAAAGAVEGLWLKSSRTIFGSAKPPCSGAGRPLQGSDIAGLHSLPWQVGSRRSASEGPERFYFFLTFALRSFKSQNDLVEIMRFGTHDRSNLLNLLACKCM